MGNEERDRPPQLNGAICGCRCRCSNVVCGPGAEASLIVTEDDIPDGRLQDEYTEDEALIDGFEDVSVQGDEGAQGYEWMESSERIDGTCIRTPFGGWKIADNNEFVRVEKDDDDRTLCPPTTATLYTHNNTTSMSVLACSRGTSGSASMTTSQTLYGISDRTDEINISFGTPPPEQPMLNEYADPATILFSNTDDDGTGYNTRYPRDLPVEDRNMDP